MFSNTNNNRIAGFAAAGVPGAEGLLNVPWIVGPLRVLIAVLTVLAVLLAVAAILMVTGSLVRMLRPSNVRAWWASAPRRVTGFTAGAFGAEVGLTLADVVEENRQVSATQTEMLDAVNERLDSIEGRITDVEDLVLESIDTAESPTPHIGGAR